MPVLQDLLRQFAILGPDPVDPNGSGLEFPEETPALPVDGEEVEYDEFGNPIPKAPVAGEDEALDAPPVSSCGCQHNDPASIPAEGGIVPQAVEEDEFDFNF